MLPALQFPERVLILAIAKRASEKQCRHVAVWGLYVGWVASPCVEQGPERPPAGTRAPIATTNPSVRRICEECDMSCRRSTGALHRSPLCRAPQRHGSCGGASVLTDRWQGCSFSFNDCPDPGLLRIVFLFVLLKAAQFLLYIFPGVSTASSGSCSHLVSPTSSTIEYV
jgi:hypothetical protein